MQIAGGKKLSIVEWVVIFVSAMLAVGITEGFGISEKWENAVVYTVIVFTVVVVALRPAWGRSTFWKTLLSIFLLHVLAVVMIEQSLPPGDEGVRGVPLIVAGMAESIFIAGVLWKRSRRPNSHRS